MTSYQNAAHRSLFWKRKSGAVCKVRNASRVVRKGDWKSLEATDDLGERFLFHQHPQLAEQLSAELGRWEQSVTDW